MTSAADPRPLTGEPLSIDLLNTRWIDGTGHHDLLADVEGLAVWLDSPPVRRALGDLVAGADRPTLDRLLRARAALDGLVASSPDFDGDALAAANAVLSHGWTTRSLTAEGPLSAVRVEEPSWGPAWAAVDDFLRLLGEHPERIRACANSECVLYFYDTSKSGRRRWCSMAGCGNRAKAMRHYQRTTRN
ncbi:CGNR zinc finger domain-containing protein [Saccharomonospora cyanea]|uniref:Zn-ribbon-like motif containing protein n=1 Tax=Saccharomonospora cyanea NA-134 TaxID=882082 RepID=H5XGR9_9PSEU|nr:CGNR zinc finger domain-containing protein [Saccharomonospora cyanea]EHR61612.1 Zn-ribbon-like motif containing protein [Saccharomonospora cyanea NA-134]